MVLDASALLAHLLEEPGADVVQRSLDEGASMSAVNWSEVLAKLADLGSDPREIATELRLQGLFASLEIVAFGAEDAGAAAELRKVTREAGLSLGDRACLSLGLRLKTPVVTADRAWDEIDMGIEVTQIR